MEEREIYICGLVLTSVIAFRTKSNARAGVCTAGECRKPLVERWQCAATCGWQWCQPPEATCKDRRAWCVKRVAKHGVKACAASAKVALTCVHSCGGCPKPDAAQLM